MEQRVLEVLERFKETLLINCPRFVWYRIDVDSEDICYAAYYSRNVLLCDKTYYPIRWERVDEETNIPLRYNGALRITTPIAVNTQTWWTIFEYFVLAKTTSPFLLHFLLKENSESKTKVDVREVKRKRERIHTYAKVG